VGDPEDTAPRMVAPINLRSDTQTLPTEQMRRAMAEAEVGDETYGEDPTVDRLERLAAERLGAEAALLVISGTMANLVSLMTHCQPGDEVFVDREAHLVYYEAGGLASIAGTMPTFVESERGHILPDALDRAIRRPNIHYPRPRLVWLENTHNRGAGSVMSLSQQRAVEAVARQRSLAIHLDGARIFNAAAAQGIHASDHTRGVDSTIVDLTKGLSCPLGALILGSRDFIEAGRFRKRMLGGGMRQAGVIAACGIVALETLIDRIPEDHELARELAERLAEIDGFSLDPASVETNMIYVDVSMLGSSTDVVAQLRHEGVLVSDRPPNQVRFVTHLQVTRELATEAVRRCAAAAGRLTRGRGNLRLA
jgi:threonine aldolase